MGYQVHTLGDRIRKNRKELFLELVVAKKGKVVPLLSTLHSKKGEERGIDKKPEVISHNNATKSGFDAVYQMVGC